MSKLVITGWRKGCSSLAAIKAIRARAHIPLNEAVDLVTRVLCNELVEVAVPTTSDAKALADSLSEAGLEVERIAD